MEFSGRQWLLSIILDVLIKTVPIYLVTVLATFGPPPVGALVFWAAAISTFHFVCLFLACSLMASLELVRIETPRVVKFPLALITANILFAVSLTAILTLSVGPNEIGPGFYSNAIVSLVLVVTNLMSILIASACGSVLSRVSRLH